MPGLNRVELRYSTRALSPELLLMMEGSSQNMIAFPLLRFSKAFSGTHPTASRLRVFFGRMLRGSCRICPCEGRAAYLNGMPNLGDSQHVHATGLALRLFVQAQGPLPKAEATRR
jgi:hypothetical protein